MWNWDVKGGELMLIASNFILGWLNSMFHKIMLLLDSMVYWAVSMVYQLFIRLATLRIFEDSFFSDFANRIYAILGVFMLFYLAYALLNALIDPEKLSGDKGVSKIASNLVISLVLLGLIPTIFDYAYRLQNYILSSNLIGAVILNTSMTNPTNEDETLATQESMIRFGDSLAFTVMNTFINPDNYNVLMANDYTWYNFKNDVLTRSDYSSLSGLADSTVKSVNEYGNDGETDVVVKYYLGVSTAVGIFLLYIIISFTIDLGVRVVKFAFCQLIAPIPIIMRAMPGKKSTFDKWLKTTLSVYFEVFVRVAIMYIAVYFVKALYMNWDWEQFGGIQGMLALVVVILGIFMFAKQAPKMLGDMLGIESGNLKLGIGEKLKAGGFFAGGAMLGAGVTGLVQRGVSGIRGIGNRWGETHGFLNKGKLLAGGLLGTAGSMAAGATSGMFHSFKSGKDAKSFGDMRKAASEGAKISLDNKGKREAYKAAHGGTVRGAMAGHITDTVSGIGQWAGLNVSLEGLKQLQSGVQEVKDARKAVDDRAMAILNKFKNTMQARNTYSVAGVGNFVNYADLLNEMDIMKSTGKTSGGATVTAQMLTQMSQAEYNMREAMKKDIIEGYDLAGGLGAKFSDFSKYDSELKELVTAYRTKSLKNASAIVQNVADGVNTDEFVKQAINNQKEELEDFIMTGDVNKLFDGSSKDAINSAVNEVNVKVARRIEREQQKKS